MDIPRRMDDVQGPTIASVRVIDPGQANVELSQRPADVIVLAASGDQLEARVLRAGTARRFRPGALVAFAHDILAVGGLDEHISDPRHAVDDLAMRLALDGVRVAGLGTPANVAPRPIHTRIEPPPRSLPGPKRTLVDAEHTEIRRYLGRVGSGWFLEIGANEPVTLSQTHHLERIGWRGVLVEPIPELANRLLRERPGSTVVEAVCSRPGSPPRLPLRLTEDSGHATLMQEFADASDVLRGTIQVDVTTADVVIETVLGGKVDFISIDVEGHEAEVLAGLNLERWRPSLVLVEDDMRTLRPTRLLWSKGYRMLRRTQNNNWRIPCDAPHAMSLHERWRMLGKFLRMPTRWMKRR